MAVHAPSFRDAALWWLKLGFISFGGPAGQIATMHRELVERRRWISEGRFQHALAYCTVLPGPEAQQLATYIGWLLHGIPGGIVAGGLFVLPSFFVLSGLTWLYLAYGSMPLVAATFAGVKPAVVAVVFLAAWRIARRALGNWPARGLAAVTLLACLLGVPFPILVLVALALGRTGHFGAARHASSRAAVDDEAVIGDHHAAPPGRPVLVTGASLALGAAAYLLLGDDLRAMAGFFTGLALLTFGGAYAVLPYLHDGAIARGWISSAQMMDGLALGETTPGPLIMVVTFVGFVARGWAGAGVATFFTFLPSFCFILAGAPLVERARAVPSLAGPLAAVSAAVVGVILHLGLRLAQHALLPEGHVDYIALVVMLGSLYLFIRRDTSMMLVLAGAALLGLLRGLG
ncbi:MAG: chromate efflux transporter [Deltaproteobacteria bacterium]|nr:chromate efflux transporter [Deltaproteobacteria bacterium]